MVFSHLFVSFLFTSYFILIHGLLQFRVKIHLSSTLTYDAVTDLPRCRYRYSSEAQLRERAAALNNRQPWSSITAEGSVLQRRI